MQVRDALRNTANNTASPNNVYGWGLINAYKAILYFGEVWGNEIFSVNNNILTIRIGFASNDFKHAVNNEIQLQNAKLKKIQINRYAACQTI